MIKFRILEECNSKKEFEYCWIHEEKFKSVDARYVFNKCGAMQYYDNLVNQCNKLRYLNKGISETELVDEIFHTINKANMYVSCPTVLPEKAYKIVEESMERLGYELDLCDGFYSYSYTEWKSVPFPFTMTAEEIEKHSVKLAQSEALAYRYKGQLFSNRKRAYGARCRSMSINGDTDSLVHDTIMSILDYNGGEMVSKEEILAVVNETNEMSLASLNRSLSRLNRSDIDGAILNKNDEKKQETYVKLNEAGYTIHGRREYITKYKVNKESNVSPNVIRKHWDNLSVTFNDLNSKI